MLSDLWSPIEDVHRTLAQLSANGAHGHLVQVVDPAEETFPYLRPRRVHRSGRTGIDHGRPRRSVARGLPEAARAPPRRDPRRDRPARLELHHPPHRPSGERASARGARPDGRGAPASSGIARWHAGGRMIGGLPLGFAQPLVLLGLLSLPVLWWLLRLVPPRPRRIEASAPTRLLFDIAAQGRNARAHAVVADAAASHARRAAHHRGRRPAVESAARDLAGVRAARAADRRRLGRGRAPGTSRVRTAEDLIARAETDGRGVAIIPLSEVGRDISLRNAGRRARAAAPDQAEAAHASSAARRCRRSRASSQRRPIASKCCGSPTASTSRRSAEFVAELGASCCKASPSRWSRAASRPRMRSPPPTTPRVRSP